MGNLGGQLDLDLRKHSSRPGPVTRSTASMVYTHKVPAGCAALPRIPPHLLRLAKAPACENWSRVEAVAFRHTSEALALFNCLGSDPRPRSCTSGRSLYPGQPFERVASCRPMSDEGNLWNHIDLHLINCRERECGTHADGSCPSGTNFLSWCPKTDRSFTPFCWTAVSLSRRPNSTRAVKFPLIATSLVHRRPKLASRLCGELCQMPRMKSRLQRQSFDQGVHL